MEQQEEIRNGQEATTCEPRQAQVVGENKEGRFFFPNYAHTSGPDKKIASDSDISVRAFDLFVVERRPKLCLLLKIT